MAYAVTQNLIPSPSLMSAFAALEPVSRGDRAAQIQWLLPRKHGKQTWKLEARWLGPLLAVLSHHRQLRIIQFSLHLLINIHAPRTRHHC